MLSNYFKATPKKWRLVGDTLLAVSAFITENALSSLQTGQANVNEIVWVARIAIGIGVIGKFLTNFFKEDELPVSSDSEKLPPPPESIPYNNG
jgi:hypothetical protein